MNEVLIGKTVAYAAKQGGGTISGIKEIDLLAAGAFAVFNEDNVMVASGAGAGSQAGKDFYFAVGVSTNDPAGGVTVRRSRLIPATPALVVKKSFAATVAKVIEVGYNGTSGSLGLPSTLITGSLATLKVFITEEVGSANPLFMKGNAYQPAIKAINITVRVLATHTQDSLVAAIASEINANAHNDFVSAAVTGTFAGGDLNIELTGTKNYQTFFVAVDDLLAEATRTVTTEIDFGHGSSVEVAEVEKLANIENGDTARIWYADKFFKQPSQVTAGEQYASWNYSWDKKSDVKYGIDSKVAHRVAIFVGDGDAIETNLTTIAAAFSLTVVDGDTW